MLARVPISALLIQSGEPAMHLPAVLALLDGTRVDHRPIEVVRVGDLFRIRNGRHRFVAAVLRGDEVVTVYIKTEPPMEVPSA